MIRRPMVTVGAVAVVAVVAVFVLIAVVGGFPAPSKPSTAGATATPGSSPPVTPRPTIRPIPKHEVFGFLPYWEMTDGIAEHVAATKLSTLALHSVTNRRNGTLNTTQTGYERITGKIGARLIREAHERGVAVQVVFTSFGTDRNARFFDSVKAQDRTIQELVAMAVQVGVDGINVDVEQLDRAFVPAYGAFVGRLREALQAAITDGQVSASTGAGRTGAAMALAASSAGADRIFLMGYDYHYGASEVGASAPVHRRDGSDQDLVWSLDLYESLGVPAEKTILGLPLYGIRWRVAGPELGAPRLGDGAIWVPSDNPNFLANPPAEPVVDPVEVVEFYSVAPTESPLPGDSRATAGWQAIYVDSPRTLAPKLALADERGLAGGGFWAIGYERGQPGYAELIATFAAGKLEAGRP